MEKLNFGKIAKDKRWIKYRNLSRGEERYKYAAELREEFDNVRREFNKWAQIKRANDELEQVLLKNAQGLLRLKDVDGIDAY